MGADYEGQEKDIEVLRELCPQAKGFLSHHIRNSLSIIIAKLELEEIEGAKKEVWHIVSDLNKAGL